MRVGVWIDVDAESVDRDLGFGEGVRRGGWGLTSDERDELDGEEERVSRDVSTSLKACSSRSAQTYNRSLPCEAVVPLVMTLSFLFRSLPPRPPRPPRSDRLGPVGRSKPRIGGMTVFPALESLKRPGTGGESGDSDLSDLDDDASGEDGALR